jgi:hypothetical protein
MRGFELNRIRSPCVPYGSVGNGSSQHLADALFERLVGAQMQ